MKSVFVGLFLLEIVVQYCFRRAGWGIENNGISFGLMKGVSTVIIGLIIIGFYLFSGNKLKKDWGFMLLLSGGLANLFSRIILGEVWDYIKLPLINLWFNGADLLISIGVLKLLIHGN